MNNLYRIKNKLMNRGLLAKASSPCMAPLPYGFPVIFVCLNAQRWLLSLLLVGMLIGFVTNAAAQTTMCPADLTETWPDNTLCLGTVADINLVLRFPATVDGKFYYFLDRNGDNDADGRVTGDGTVDTVTVPELKFLLTGSKTGDITNTQDDGTGHNGSDDARSVIVGGYTLVLPTIKELDALQAISPKTTPHPTDSSQPDIRGGAPPNWLGGGSAYATASPSTRSPRVIDNFIYTLDQPAGTAPGIPSSAQDHSANSDHLAVAFQVIPENLFFRIKVFLEGAQ